MSPSPPPRVTTPGHFENVMWLVKQVYAQQRHLVEETHRVHGVTATQGGVLVMLREQPGLSGTKLARILDVTPQAAAVALATLEERGLVYRTADPNHGRIMRAFLTDEGARIAENCRADSLELQEKLYAVLNAKERRTFEELLRRLVTRAIV